MSSNEVAPIIEDKSPVFIPLTARRGNDLSACPQMILDDNGFGNISEMIEEEMSAR